jgi:hypothetical protein
MAAQSLCVHFSGTLQLHFYGAIKIMTDYKGNLLKSLLLEVFMVIVGVV